MAHLPLYHSKLFTLLTAPKSGLHRVTTLNTRYIFTDLIDSSLPKNLQSENQLNMLNIVPVFLVKYTGIQFGKIFLLEAGISTEIMLKQ